MLKNGWTWFIVLLFAVFFLWPRGKPVEVKPGVVTVRDSVVVHDTVYVSIAQPTIKKKAVKKEVLTAPPPYVVIMDSLKDTAINYSIEQSFERGAFVKADMSSKEFPERKPKDFEGLITYVPPIDSIRIERQTDTVPEIIYKKPIIPTWQAVTLGLLGGIVVGWIALK